ncbi:MAG: DUF1552 domain-containing protein [Planctomycetota bacterium]
MKTRKNTSQRRLDRRRFVREAGIGAGLFPFIAGLPSLRDIETPAARPRKRLVIVFSPNGTLPGEFWPDNFGDDQPLQFKSMLSALDPFADQTLMLHGVHNKIRGDGDNHMRGMSCLLTATELRSGNIQGGSDAPAGWANGISVDQEVRNFFQANPETRTRFGSLEFGVAVPNRADPWTRMVYSGADQPVAPIDNPAVMFRRLYGGGQDRELVGSVLDQVKDDLRRLESSLAVEDREMLLQHMQHVRELENGIEAAAQQERLQHPEPEIDPEIELVNDNTPDISRMQIDMMVNALANDLTRVATLQFMRSVGQARMRWLDVQEGHHSLSHEPDDNKEAYEKLKRINSWFSGELAYLARRLAETPEPGGDGSNMLDNTQIVWLNELGKGNSHSLNNIPFMLIGGGCGFRNGRALELGGQAHNRLWLSIAHGLGHDRLETFGTARHCAEGPLALN